MTGRGIRPLSGRSIRARSRGRARGRIIRGGRSNRGFRNSRVRQRGDFGPITVTVNRNESRDYIVENCYSPKHYPEIYDESEYYHYRSRSRSWSRSRSRTRSRTISRSRSRSISRSPYRRISHHRHYSRSRSRSYSPPRRRSRSFSRSISRSPPPRYRIPRHESSLERIPGSSRKQDEEIRRREQTDRAQKRPVDRHAKQIKVKVAKKQVKAVKEQVKIAKEKVKIVKEQFKKITPLPEVVKKESPPPVKESAKLPATVRDMPIYSDESDDEDSRLPTPQAKKEERFRFETDVNKDIRSQLLERAMIEKKKLGLENPGAAEKSSALEALQCYSPETHSPSPTSHHSYDTHNIPESRKQMGTFTNKTVNKKAIRKKKVAPRKDPLKSIFKSSDEKTEILPSIPGLGFSSIEDEEKFLYGDDDEKDEDKNISGDEEEEEEEDEEDDDDSNIDVGQTAIAIQPEIKPNIKAETIPKAAVKTNLVETKDWSNNQTNLPFQDIPPKRRRLLTSDSDNAMEYVRGEVVPKTYAGSTILPEIIERNYSASDMIDLQFSEKLCKDSPSQFRKSSLSPPVKKTAEKGSRLEFTSQFDVKQPPIVSRRKDSLEERLLKHQSPSSDSERKYNKTEKYFHPTVPGQRSKREESPPRKEHTPRYKSRHELFEETERKHRERNRKSENLRPEERSRNWETSPRNRSFDRSPWRSPEEKKKWESYRDYTCTPRNLSLERSSCHSRSPREPYYDRSPSSSPRRWSSPRGEVTSSRWSPRQEPSPRKGDSSNDKKIDWLQTSHRDHYYDRQPSPSQHPDEAQSRSPDWKKEYENSYQQQVSQSFDTPSLETYATSQHISTANADSTETAASYTIPQQSYYHPVGAYPSVNPHMTYSSYNTAFPQAASYGASFPSYITMPPTLIQVSQQPLTRAQETVTRTNLTVIPLHNEVETPKETKHNFTASEDVRKKHETSKCTFVTISDNSHFESNHALSIDYSMFSYKELLDRRADKKKHLTLLQNEMAKLCKMQGELMRKKQKEKDGHKDALIVENTKLQEEVSNQIQESKQELLQIKLAIRKCLEETEKKKEIKRQEKLEKKIEEGQKEEHEKEQNQRQHQKYQMEEKMEEATDDPLDSGTNFNFKYFDPGNHWCKHCNEMNPSIFKLFQHLHSSKHKQKMSSYDRPWATLNQRRESEKSLGSQTIAAPIKGVQFLVPLEGFYCSICKEILPDAISAEEHLKSTSHNRSYTKYILLNPFYERRWNLDKAAGIAAAEKEEKKRQKELSLEAKNKKREEAEKRRKEFIKNEKAKEIKRIHDIPPAPLSNNKPFESYIEKDASKPKPKAIRLTLLGDKGKLTKQKKEEKTPPFKETKSVPVIYIGKAPNYRSMAHKQDKEKQDVSGFGKFNWKKDENEIVPEDQTPVPEEFKAKQEDQSPKAEEMEQMEKLKKFPLRKSKKPQLNLVYGPEPPPDLHLRESLQAPPTQEKGDGLLPSEMDIAQAFAGKFEGNESSAVSKNQHSHTAVNETFLIIDETPLPKHEIHEEEIKPTATLKETMPTGPSRQMMLMLKSVESMSKETKFNLFTSKLADGAYKSHSLLAKTENSHLISKPIVAVAGNVSRIQPMQMATVLRPPGEEDIFVTENINIKPPPLKPQLSKFGPSESFMGNTSRSSTWPENVNKPTEIVVGNVNKSTTVASMGNMSRPSVTVMGNANKTRASIAAKINKCEAAAVVSESKSTTDTTIENVMTVANKSNLMETENKVAIASETIKHPAMKESESRSFPIMAGNIARIQPQQITNVNKSEEVSLTFTKTIERIKSEVIPVSQTTTYQEGMDSTGSTTCVVPVTRPKVQIIFPTIKTTETNAVLQLKENLMENELSIKSITNVLKMPSEYISDAMTSKEQLNIAGVESSQQTIVREICGSIDNLLKGEHGGNQRVPKVQSRDVVLHPNENALEKREDSLLLAVEKISGTVLDEIKKEAVPSLISLQNEKEDTCISSHAANNQTLSKVESVSSSIEEHCFQTGTPHMCTEVDKKGSTVEIDHLIVAAGDSLQLENETECRSAKEDVRETLPENDQQMVTEFKASCDDLIKVEKFQLAAGPSLENVPRLNTDNIPQNEVNENNDKEPSVCFDYEASATSSNLEETKFQQQIGNEGIENMETDMNDESERSSKLLPDCEVIETVMDSVNIVDATRRQIYPENKTEQIDDQVLCNDSEETKVRVEREALHSERALNSKEGATLSNVIPKMSLKEDYQKEHQNKSMATEPGNGLQSEFKPSCNSESSICEAGTKVSKGSLEREITKHSSHSEEKVDTSIYTESSNLSFSSESLNAASISTKEVESMKIDCSNHFYSDEKTQCIEGIYSELNVTENIAKECLKLEEDSQNPHDEQGKMSMNTAAESDISFGTEKSAVNNTMETAETMETVPGLHFHDERHCPVQISVPKAAFIENISKESLEQTSYDNRQEGNVSISAEPCEIAATVLLEETENSLLDDRSEQQVPAEALITKKAERMEIDCSMTFQDEVCSPPQVLSYPEAAISENISRKSLEQEVQQNSFDKEKTSISADSYTLPFDKKHVVIGVEKGSPVNKKSEQQIPGETLDDGRTKDNAVIKTEINISKNKHETSVSIENKQLSDTVISDSSFCENETSGIINNTEKDDIAKNLLSDKSKEEEIKYNMEREVYLGVKAETIASTIIENTATELEASVSKSEQLNDDTASSKTEIDFTCPQADSGYSCDQEALNLNEDTVEFYESLSPKEHIPGGDGENSVSSFPNLNITFPEAGTQQSKTILSFESDKEVSTKLSFDNAGLGTSINLTNQKIGISTEINSILSGTSVTDEMEVDTEIKVTSSPQEETTDEVEETGLVIPVGFSPTQHIEEKADSPEEKPGGYFKEASVPENTFGIDDADATIQALENLLEETKQLHSPAAKSFKSMEVAVLAEENTNADVRQKNE